MRGLSFRYSVLSFCVSYGRSMSMSTASNGSSSTTTTSSITAKRIAAVAQLRSTSNKQENLINVAICARMAKDQGACMLFLPECFGFIGENSDQTLEQAEAPILSSREDSTKYSDVLETNTDSVSASLIDAIRSGVTKGSIKSSTSQSSSSSSPPPPDRIHLLDGLRTIARETGLWISGGGMHESGAPADEETGSPRVYNTHVIVDDQGDVRATYRKMHLFDVSIPGKVHLRESKTTAPGSDLVVCDSPVGTLFCWIFSSFCLFGRCIVLWW
jgi:Carbon-nitrogen hydrolase